MIKLWTDIHWPQVAALAVVVAGAVCSLVFVPADFWTRIDWRWLISMGLTAAGVGVSAALPGLRKPKPPGQP